MRTLAAVFFLLALSASAQDIALPYRLVTLDNGLQLVLQPDPSMPQIGVEYWIRGGSREEAAGQHGIAHLFEHNVPYSGRFHSNAANRALRSRTGRGGGAGTEPDFLRFYSYTTPEGLEVALASAAGRLESEQESFSAETVAKDQDIVISELRRGGNIDWDVEILHHLHRGTYGADHPYGHSVSGSEADVRAATVDLMRDWHRRFSGASNAILFVVGNFDPAKVEPLVRKYFAPIPPGIRVPRPTELVPAARARRDVLEKDVARPIVYMRWPVPGWGTADGDYLTLLAHILTARLEDATASVQLLELAGSFNLRGSDEAPMRAELGRILSDGVSESELARAKAVQQADFVRLLQRGVWRYSRADTLGFGLLFRNDPEVYRQQLARTSSATVQQLDDTARRWLAMPGYVLHVMPRPKRAAAGTIDRAATIAAGEATPVAYPKVEAKRLPNGLRTILATREGLPLAQLTVAYPSGTDVEAIRRALAADLAALGSEVTTDTRDPDYATLSVSVLSARANEALALLGTQAEAEILVVSGNLHELPPAATRISVRQKPRPPASLKPSKEQFIVKDNPTATQAQIVLSLVLPDAVAKDPLAAELVMYALRTRLMNNLRTTKGWSYEVYPFGVVPRRGGATARFHIPVQTAKTAEAIAEVRKEIAALHAEPVSAEFLGTIRGYLEGNLTASLSSLAQLNVQLLDIARNDLAPDAHARMLARLQNFTPAELQAAAKTFLRPGELLWTITGERTAIEGELKELGVPFALDETR